MDSFQSETLSPFDLSSEMDKTGFVFSELSFTNLATPSFETLLARVDELAAKLKDPDVNNPPHIRTRKIGKYLYLPVFDDDDIEQYVLLARLMKTRGWQIIIGTPEALSRNHWGHLPSGVVVFRALDFNGAKQMFSAEKTGGHLCCVVGHEGVVNPWAHRFADKVSAECLPLPECEPADSARVVIFTDCTIVNSERGHDRSIVDALRAAGLPIAAVVDGVRAEVLRQHESMARVKANIVALKDYEVVVRPARGEDSFRYLESAILKLPVWEVLRTARVAVCERGSPLWGRIHDAGFPLVDAKSEDVVGDVARAVASARVHFDSALPEILNTLWALNQYPHPFHLRDAWSARGGDVLSKLPVNDYGCEKLDESTWLVA